MASVACCPKCRHDLLIPDGVDPNAWAQCYACNVLFQVCDAAPREVAPAVMLDAASNPPADPPPPETRRGQPSSTVALSSEQTIGEINFERDVADVAAVPAKQSAAGILAGSANRSALTIADISSKSSATWVEGADQADRAAAELPDQDVPALPTVIEPIAELPYQQLPLVELESLQQPSVDEVVPLADHDEVTIVAAADSPVETLSPRPSADVGATVEFSGDVLASGGDIDIDLGPEKAAATTPNQPTWDDSDHMDRLLGTVDAPPAENGGQGQVTAPAAADEVIEPSGPPVNDLVTMLARPTPGRRRRNRSLVRTLIGIAVSGLIGTAVGYYLLLAWQGPDGDVLQIAHYLPSAMLPGSFSSLPSELANTQSPTSGQASPVQQVGFADNSTGPEQRVEPEEFTVEDDSPLPVGAAAGLMNAPPLSTADMEIALRSAKQAQAGLTTGDLSDAAVRRTKGDSFEALCRLAQVATFVQASPISKGDASLLRDADELFRDMLADPRVRNEVARIVPVWIASPHRTNQGVFLAGVVTPASSRGSVAEFQIDTGVSGGEPLTILMSASLAKEASESSRRVGIVGTIIDGPTQRISGYTGDATQVIWASSVLTLD